MPSSLLSAVEFGELKFEWGLGSPLPSSEILSSIVFLLLSPRIFSQQCCGNRHIPTATGINYPEAWRLRAKRLEMIPERLASGIISGQDPLMGC